MVRRAGTHRSGAKGTSCRSAGAVAGKRSHELTRSHPDSSSAASEPGFRWFHPWIGEIRLRSLRLSAQRLRRLALTVGQLALLLMAVAWVAYEHHMGLAETVIWTVENLVGGLTFVFAAAAALSYFGVRRRVAALHHELTEGWWAAQPVKSPVIRRTLLLVALVYAGQWVVICSLLCLAALPVAPRTDLQVVWIVIVGALTLGALCGFQLFRPAQATSKEDRHRKRIVDPVYQIWSFEHRTLGGLPEWQRRDARLQWRNGGNFWMFGVVLVALPSGIPDLSALGLMLLATAAIWYGVVLRASVRIAIEAADLLAATPLSVRRLGGALTFYPGSNALLASLASAIGAWMMGSFWMGLLLTLVILIILSVGPAFECIALLCQRRPTRTPLHRLPFAPP